MDTDLLSSLHDDLLKAVDEGTKTNSHRFFKEAIHVYGIKTADAGAIAKKYYKQIKEWEKGEIVTLCERLLSTDYNEDAYIAFDWAYRLHPRYDERDFELFERWIGRYINNWAKCDTLCNHAVGTFLERYPSYLSRLKVWATSDNRWFRRAAAVSLVLPARKGMFLGEIFEIAELLLRDEDDLVQKGYGWMLKEASKPYQSEVFEFVEAHKGEMPRTALRYAIEKMPDALRRQAMEK